jgi:hypothetical protein
MYLILRHVAALFWAKVRKLKIKNGEFKIYENKRTPQYKCHFWVKTAVMNENKPHFIKLFLPLVKHLSNQADNEGIFVSLKINE